MMSRNNEETQSMRYEEMNLGSDFALYQRLASENMTPVDLLSGERIRTFMQEDRARAWWVFDSHQQRIGWCAVLTRAAWTEGVHLLGNFVLPDFRRHGYGRASVGWRVNLYREGEITAAVMPGNIASERALAASGFTGHELVEGGWRLWKRPAGQRG
ncbi:Uncharacterised protein [Serratia quinivorans]|nr:Uncharacterised protein [Serratia quinivorans]CAI1697696.1 Uncharacterised protein [Serratia quinivorans]